ncbi:MAG: alpha-2-macroglobulin [Rubrivivax sp.]|nr:alpha-2-macroglobulin [Rubrivivax sp.]
MTTKTPLGSHRARQATARGAALALMALAALTAFGSADAASISRATPQGEVSQVRQLVLGFDVPVVTLGTGAQPDPAELQCEGPVPEGRGRWVNPQLWTYDFRRSLPPGVSCTLAIKPGWKPLEGSLGGRTRFSFQTGGPAVERIEPYEGATIEEDQHFLLQFNGAPSAATLAANAWCEVEGIGERLPVRIESGPPREALLRERGRLQQADRLVLLSCQRPLPHEAGLRLVLGPGIAAQANAALRTRDTRSFRYSVRRAFSADFSCERERAQAPCLPIRPLWLRLSESVPRALAQQVRLKPVAGGAALAPVFDKDNKDPEVSELRFPVPLAENARYVIELPRDFKDAAGRPLANAGSFPLTVATGEAPPIAKLAAAPFGILERLADPSLPVTLRHVQGDLRPGASAGQVRVLRVQEPLAMLQAYARVHKLHERDLSAREAGQPRERWFETVVEKDERGREVKRQVERRVGTREIAMLKTEASARRLDLPALQGGDPRPFEVVGIPLPEPGLHVVEIESRRLGEALLAQTPGQPPAPMYVRSAVLVTNLAVHVKTGRENSLVWVTSLDRARPVPQAEVQVFDCSGKPLWSGRSDAQGRARIEQPLPTARTECLADVGFFVSARKTDEHGVVDTSFAFSSWNEGINPWRFNLPLSGPQEPTVLRAHTVFDRTLLRAGETVSMKHFIRSETAAGLAWLKPEDLPTRVRIVHEGSGQESTLPMSWNGVRSSLTSWNIPAAARLGHHLVTLERPASGSGAAQRPALSLDAGSFRVEEFRVPLVDARLVPPKGALIAPQELALDVQMNFMSGGPMAQAELRGTAQWRERGLAFEDYPAFSFQPPRDIAAGTPPVPEPESGEAADSAAARLVADRMALSTDRNGSARWVMPLPAQRVPRDRPGEIRAELSYADPNGEVQTVSARVPTWPSAVVLGVRSGSWASQRGPVRVSTLALDVSGKPIKGQAVELRGRLLQTLSTRKRLVGGFYAYDNRTEVQDLGVLCTGKTDDRGLLECEARLDSAGEVELIAKAQDAAGQAAQAATSVWITRQGELWFAQDNDDRIDVLPERSRYEPGETARLQVRMPFREATALVAIEREGVIDTRVLTLRGNDPTVELKIEPGWGPNVYVSVLAVRGRVREVPWTSFFTWGWKEPLSWARAWLGEGKDYQPPTAMVDLSKPTYKFGVAQLKVGLAAHQLKVQVSADQAQYTIRGKAQVLVKVSGPDGQPAAGAEVAFAAVDEGLLALKDNDSWDLLEAMLRERPWGVETATAQSEVIGRRHYGRKAVAAGGGGGRAGARELLDTLLLWKPAVTLDARGEARIEVPLNDSLTSFRLVAVADAGVQTFGSGFTRIRVTQDLQVLAGLPPLVREGDRFAAQLTLRNTTAREMAVRASLNGTVNTPAGAGGADLARTPLNLPPQDTRIPAGGTAALSWPVQVPAGAISIQWEAAAEETPGGAGKASDRLRQLQLVKESVPTRVLQASVQPLDGSFSLPVQVPAQALAGPDGSRRGGLAVVAQAQLSGALPGIRRYFETYPFTCLEQQASKAIGLRDDAQWTALMQALPTYLDSDGLAAYFPPREADAPRGSDVLSAYLLSTAHEAGWEIPAPARERMLQGLAAFVQGRIERRFWAPRADLEVRKLAALAALARHGKADARWLGSVRTSAEAQAAWPTAALIDWLGVLQRMPALPERSAQLAQAQQQLRARLVLGGTTLRFSQEENDFWWWLMDSADSNAARLILAVMDEPGWREDLPRLVVGHLARQQRGAWLTTTANAWSALALERFGRRFESVPVAGRTRATLAAPGAAAGSAAPATIDWPARLEGTRLLLPWPAQAATLNLQHEGSGRPWITVQSLAAVPLTAPVRAGYAVTRSVSAVQARQAGVFSRGDVLRVRLEIEALADMSWVVLSDPVPAGATILGSGLGRDSAIATGTERREGAAWAAYEERSFEAFRSYWGYLPRGRHVLEYTLRLNNPGRFGLPPTRVEAMYAPESFGETPNAALEVQP